MSLPPAGGADTTVVVTGASSGIGTELARGLARRGYPLMLVARREDRLEKLAGELRAAHDVAVDVAALDLGTEEGRADLIERLGSQDFGGLCNCAGFGTSGSFHTLPLEREREEVTVNAMALMEFTHTAVRGMVRRGTGAVLNVASIAAFQPIPGMAVYSASKAFVQVFSEAVHEDLHGTGVSCTVLCPGPVPTEWAEIADAQQWSIGVAQVSPQDVAEAGIQGMLAGKRAVVPGVVPTVASLAGRFTPRSVLLPALRLANRLTR
jgi:short-subunit dehydrogenase